MKKLFNFRVPIIFFSIILKKVALLVIIFASVTSYSQKDQSVGRKIPAGMIIGPVGVPIPNVELAVIATSCTVNGVSIATSGFTPSTYSQPTENSNCTPDASFTGAGAWTAFNPAGTVTYTFSEPIFSARITYTAVNEHDVATIAINNPGMQLLNLCGLTSSGNQLNCSFPFGTYGDVALTVFSNCSFTEITLTNIGGNTGWVSGNTCNFLINPIPQSAVVMLNCPKIYLDELCYNATQQQTTTLNVFNNATNGINSTCTYATIDGVPCTAANVIIEPLSPLPFGCTFSPHGTIRIPAGTLPFHTIDENQVYYRFRSRVSPCVVSDVFRVNFGILPKVIPVNAVTYLHAGSPPVEVYSNGSINVLTTPLISQINTSTAGVCGYIPAVIDFATVSNTVSITETTSPQNPYYRIAPNGSIVFRPPYSSNNPPPAAPNLSNPNTYYELTYRMCINNTGATTFCADQRVSIIYYYGFNRTALLKNNPESLIILPNPSVDGKYTLTLNEESKGASLEIYNMLGQKIYGEKITNAKEHQLFLDNLPKGTYILRLDNDGKIITKNILRQ